MTTRPSIPAPKTVDASFLGPPTLNHLAENAALGVSVGRAIEACLRDRRRFPHTLLRGPADSGKRLLAAVIAKELSEPLLSLDISCTTSSEDLQAVFKEAGDRSIVLVTGLDIAPAAAVRDIARGVARQRLDGGAVQRPVGFPEIDQVLRRASRGPKRYADFTLIATARGKVDGSAAQFGWVERSYALARTCETESARLARVFRRAGLAVDQAFLDRAAHMAVAFGIRTLHAAGAVVEWAQGEGLSESNDGIHGDAVLSTLALAANPECVERSQQLVESMEALAAEAAASDAPKLILP
ncbi:MAG: hypothetical protein ACKOV8_06285 [Phycisphaerales bacterium]